MYVHSVRVSDYSTGSEYTYGDQTGDFESIKIASGNSTIAKILSEPPPKSLHQRWNELAPGAKIAVYASIGAFIALVLSAWALCCIKHRRAGKREGAFESAAFEKDTAELMAYRADLARSRSNYSEYAGGRERY